jgi:hypothetical protein
MPKTLDEIRDAEQQRFAAFQQAWERKFPSQAGYSIKGATYLGVDGQGSPMYKIISVAPWGQSFTYTFTLVSGSFGDPVLSGGGGAAAGTTTITGLTAQQREAEALKAAKAHWTKFVIDNVSITDAAKAAELTRVIQNWSGSADGLNYLMGIEASNVPIGAIGREELVLPDLSPSGGSGSGLSGPLYRAPDRRVIEDFVKGTMVSLVGHILEGNLGRIVDIYMRDDRRNFDSPGQDINPTQSIIEAIRNTAEYQTIHKLRPDSVDERTWISDRATAAIEGGLNIGEIEDFAITQAVAGGDVEDVREAAGVTQLQNTGKAPTLLDRKFRNVALSMFGGVKR